MPTATVVYPSGEIQHFDSRDTPTEGRIKQLLGTTGEPFLFANWKKRVGLPCMTFAHPNHNAMKHNPLAGFMFMADYSRFIQKGKLYGISSAVRGPIVFVTEQRQGVANRRFIQLMQKQAG